MRSNFKSRFLSLVSFTTEMADFSWLFSFSKTPFKDVEKDAKGALGTLTTTAKQLLKGLEGFAVFMGEGLWSIMKLMIKVFNVGDTVKIWGYAPYIALPGLVLVPFQMMTPGAVQFLDAPFEILGITDATLLYYQFVSVLYWMLLGFYNFYEGEALNEVYPVASTV